jgi:large subunit ribosomal protein L1
MAKVSKRVAANVSKVDRNKTYPLADALALVKQTATAKFDESVDAG